MPPVADLHRLRQRPARRLAVGPRAVTAQDLDPGMVPQPCLGHVRGPARNDIDAAAGLGVDQHGRVDQAAAQREVVDSQHPRHRRTGQAGSAAGPAARYAGKPRRPAPEAAAPRPAR